MKATAAEKLTARNALDYQARVLDSHKQRWQEQWEAAANPFEALVSWTAGKAVRAEAYIPWRKAKDLTELHEMQAQKL